MDPYAKQARLASIAGLNSDTERTSGVLQFPTCECGCEDRQEQCVWCGDDIEFQDEVWIGLQPFHPSCAPNQDD